jgi:hypothetical protein
MPNAVEYLPHVSRSDPPNLSLLSSAPYRADLRLRLIRIHRLGRPHSQNWDVECEVIEIAGPLGVEPLTMPTLATWRTTGRKIKEYALAGDPPEYPRALAEWTCTAKVDVDHIFGPYAEEFDGRLIQRCRMSGLPPENARLIHAAPRVLTLKSCRDWQRLTDITPTHEFGSAEWQTSLDALHARVGRPGDPLPPAPAWAVKWRERSRQAAESAL